MTSPTSGKNEHPAITRARELAWVNEWSGNMHVNMTRMVGAARVLSKAYDALKSAIELGGLDLAPCWICGKTIACLPDGMPLCSECHAKDVAP
jgi:hypothetical protein